MKRFFLFLLFSLNFWAFAQIKPIYFAGDVIVSDATRATSYAIYGKLTNEDLWVVKQYDLSNQLISTGSYRDSLLAVPHGVFTYYNDITGFNEVNKTGYILKGKTKFIYMKGGYTEGKRTGQWFTFYPDGKVREIICYELGQASGEYKMFDKRGTVLEIGKYMGGKKDGEWISSGGKQTNIYKMGKLIATFKNKKNKND
ncbi:MAG: hypothetical protein V4541_10310 [Bacteroidota bacterium]